VRKSCRRCLASLLCHWITTAGDYLTDAGGGDDITGDMMSFSATGTHENKK